MGDGVDLMGSQCDFGIDTHKVQMLAVILTGTNAVKLFVIQLAKPVPSLLVFPYPVGKSVLYKLLFALCNGSFLFVQHRLFIAVFVLHIIKDTHITEIQRFFNDFVSVDSACAVGIVYLDISSVVGLALNIPFTRVLRIMHMDVPRDIPCRTEKLEHKLFNILRRQPSCTEPDGYFTCSKVFRHNLG